jgi:hypothetical protein
VADLCARILGDASQFAAEPVAAATDLAQADATLELAIYAGDPQTCATALVSCGTWLRWAQNIYAPDTPQADRAACAAAQVEAWAQAVPSGAADLAAFQQGPLRAFHGVIGALMGDTYTVGPAADAALDFYAVLGALVVTYAGWTYLEWKKAHGGYRTTSTGRLPRLA